MAAGALELAGVDARPGGGRGVVGGDTEQPLADRLRGGAVLKTDSLGCPGECVALEGGVPAAFLIEHGELVQAVPQADHVGGTHGGGTGVGGWQGGGCERGRGSGAKAAAEHG